jgi:hypothetical protein
MYRWTINKEAFGSISSEYLLRTYTDVEEARGYYLELDFEDWMDLLENGLSLSNARHSMIPIMKAQI